MPKKVAPATIRLFKGQTGERGAIGAQGAKGDPGVKGDPGFKGDKGNAGQPTSSSAVALSYHLRRRIHELDGFM